MLDCTLDILKHKGMKGLYAGYFPLILREVPFSSIQFPFYEILKMTQIKMVALKTGQNESSVQIPALANAINGSVAGSFAGFIVTPFDVAKTKLMTYNVKETAPSTFGLLKLVYKEEGIRGLYKGAAIRMMYLGVGGFAFFGIYEKVKLSLLSTMHE